MNLSCESKSRNLSMVCKQTFSEQFTKSWVRIMFELTTFGSVSDGLLTSQISAVDFASPVFLNYLEAPLDVIIGLMVNKSDNWLHPRHYFTAFRLRTTGLVNSDHVILFLGNNSLCNCSNDKTATKKEITQPFTQFFLTITN